MSSINLGLGVNIVLFIKGVCSVFISNVEIKNFRNFRNVNVELFPFSILIGENDTGKSNFIKAINLVLFNKSQNYYSKILYSDDLII